MHTAWKPKWKPCGNPNGNHDGNPFGNPHKNEPETSMTTLLHEIFSSSRWNLLYSLHHDLKLWANFWFLTQTSFTSSPRPARLSWRIQMSGPTLLLIQANRSWKLSHDMSARASAAPTPYIYLPDALWLGVVLLGPILWSHTARNFGGICRFCLETRRRFIDIFSSSFEEDEEEDAPGSYSVMCIWKHDWFLMGFPGKRERYS